MENLEKYRSLREAVETLGIETFVARAVDGARVCNPGSARAPLSSSEPRHTPAESASASRLAADDAVARADW